ncbi:PaaI family thioesterase [Bailinhaonella thermotolerans]|uniref:Acyl-coenzyme A thioesterase THEM4 n=1 Tax=Bailinhaonella thermotolerans TaxID=1070861 RepID=A0A3A4B085_9ACTN|nr:PaaI family thioesterase [Bailinhaonella thermotolerans]RJL34249.1 PaaI family thioesterase [Bailinhaonella thermotolerans]
MTRSTVTTPPPGAVPPETHPDAPGPGQPLGPHYSRCFGCGPDHPTGLHFEASSPDGLTVTAQFTVGENHQGAPGLAHGGVLAAAMDEALGSSIWLLRKPYVTGRLETDFLRPVPVGTRLFVKAWCTGISGRKAYLEGEARMGAPDGPVAVRAAALFIEVTIDHFVEHGDVSGHEFEVNP